jgi:hypothetical protein
MSARKTKSDIRRCVERAVAKTPVLDVHTHLFPASFGGLMLWGIDELLTYHYLVAEVFRHAPMPYDEFWKLSKREQADRIWQTLFLDHSPVSEACRGPLTCLAMLKLDVRRRDLDRIRRFFQDISAEDYVDLVFRKAGVRRVVMTNDPFQPDEQKAMTEVGFDDDRFLPALRIDAILVNWANAHRQLKTWGYRVQEEMGGETIAETQRFLFDWIDRIHPVYMAASLPPGFAWPEESTRGKMITEVIVPVARKAGIPFAMMIGVNKRINPHLRDAGDGVGTADGSAVENLCAAFGENRFLVTMLARENQHRLCVAARKFHNLMPFGCWWFLNDPSLVDEITRMRTELLGLSYVPQHSDARVRDQLLYTWSHSRTVIANVLAEKYIDLADTGWRPTRKEIARDVADLLGGNFERFLAGTPRG